MNSKSSNPLLSFGQGLPNYREITSEHIEPAIDELLKKAELCVQTCLANPHSPTWRDFIEPLENATEELGRAWGVASHLNSVADTPAFREAYGKMLPKVTAFWTSLGQNLELFKKYKAIKASSEFAQLTSAQQRVIENSLRDFRLGGAELPDEQKIRFAEIQDRQAELSKLFSDHVLDATDKYILNVTEKSELDGLPEDVLDAARQTAQSKEMNGWAFTLHFPSYFPVMQFAKNRSLREQLYKAYVTRASELGPEYGQGDAKWNNSQLMLELLALRDEEARMLGYANYAALSLAPKMAKTVSEVKEFLETFAKRAKPFGQKDWDELTNFAQKNLGIESLQPWDMAYASEQLKQSLYAFSEHELKQYFPLPKVLEGLFQIIQSLFGVKIEPSNMPTWHDDVKSYQVLNASGQVMAHFYIDPYARPGKRGGAWMDDARGRKKLSDGSIQTPVAYLVCNFPPPVTINGQTKPPTITHDDVITMFHECGHGLHHMLTEIDALGVSGINGVEWDAVELPSQFMENFCWEWEVLKQMTAHSQTGEPLPKDLFEKMIRAKNFQNGLATLRQLVFSTMDWRLHSEFVANQAQASDILALSRRVNDEIHVTPQPDISRWINTFSHIFAGGYAAGYYSYKWAEVLSADAYAAFEETAQSTGSVVNSVTGNKYRQEILAVGGSRSAAESFKAFRGREPEIDALLRHGGLS